MGKPYADTLKASGGSGSFSWQLVSGALPPGLSISVNGRIAGTPSQSGAFSFTARVTSGAQQAQQTYGLTVTAPTLAKASVVAQLLSGAGLTIDEIRYVDLIGNNNCGTAVLPSCFDVGDFLAWVQATGATPSAPATSPPVVAGKGGRP
jgi:putative Ig domain-containing protein